VVTDCLARPGCPNDFSRQLVGKRANRRYNWEIMAEPVILCDSEVMNGTPCFRGTRVPFKNLIDYLEGGHSLGEFLRQFPTITQEMAIQALEEAKNSLLPKLHEGSAG
jgi:uncharacterized protein (DUF433 family)